MKVITYLDSLKAPRFDCIPVVILKKYEGELAKRLTMCLKESYFTHCSKVSSVVCLFKNVGERSTAKVYRLVSLLSVVSRNL